MSSRQEHEIEPGVPYAAASEAAAPGLTRARLLGRAALAAGGLLSLEAVRARPGHADSWPPASAYPAEVATAFFGLSLDLVRTTPGYSPPVASRAFG